MPTVPDQVFWIRRGQDVALCKAIVGGKLGEDEWPDRDAAMAWMQAERRRAALERAREQRA